AQVLVSAGVGYDAIHSRVAKCLGVRPQLPEGTLSVLPFAPRAKRVIELALEEAKQQDASQISPDHLLLGILAEYKEVPPPGGVATYVLTEEIGIDLQQLEQALREVMAG
ncbi:MAG: Clp protease N-terminal domain-containing protein, partial [Cyanobacteria bacterium J06635_11]